MSSRVHCDMYTGSSATVMDNSSIRPCWKWLIVV